MRPSIAKFWGRETAAKSCHVCGCHGPWVLNHRCAIPIVAIAAAIFYLKSSTGIRSNCDCDASFGGAIWTSKRETHVIEREELGQ